MCVVMVVSYGHDLYYASENPMYVICSDAFFHIDIRLKSFRVAATPLISSIIRLGNLVIVCTMQCTQCGKRRPCANLKVGLIYFGLSIPSNRSLLFSIHLYHHLATNASMLSQERVRLQQIVGPLYGFAVPFVFPSAEEFASEPAPETTKACSFWRHRATELSIFMTHFRWDESDRTCEVGWARRSYTYDVVIQDRSD